MRGKVFFFFDTQKGKKIGQLKEIASHQSKWLIWYFILSSRNSRRKHGGRFVFHSLFTKLMITIKTVYLGLLSGDRNEDKAPSFVSLGIKIPSFSRFFLFLSMIWDVI